MRLRRVGRLTVAASLGRAAWATRRQWQALPAERRDRLQTLLRQSAGRPSNLSPAERQELGRLIGELNLGDVLREGAMRASRRGFGHRY
jgi:hypothetical protein